MTWACLRALALLALASTRQRASAGLSLPAGTWPQCDECEAVGTQIGKHFDRQRKPKRLGGGLRNLTGMDLEELFEDTVCQPDVFAGYTMARDSRGDLRLAGEGITHPKSELHGVGMASDEATKLGKMTKSLLKNIGKRMADRCETVASSVGPGTLFSMFTYVDERGRNHAKDLCPKLAPGFTNPWPFCHPDGTYDNVVGFSQALCESELQECKQAAEAQAADDNSTNASSSTNKFPGTVGGPELAGDETLTGPSSKPITVAVPPPPPAKGDAATQEPKSMTFKPPIFNEEDKLSAAIPEAYRCDACAAVAYQLQLGLLKAEFAKDPRAQAPGAEPLLRETEVLEVLGSSKEEGGVCTHASFAGYGVLGVAAAAGTDATAEGVEKILNGDGIPHGQQGLVQKTGQWRDRLARRCEEVVGEVGELRLYTEYRQLSPRDLGLKHAADEQDQHAGLFQPLCKQLTDSCKLAAEKRAAAAAAAKGKKKKTTKTTKKKAELRRS